MATRSNRPTIRAIVAALVSAKASDTDERIRVLTSALAPHGVQIVGSLIQRRGVSRGGTKRMEAPLNSATLIGPGKAIELAQLVRDRQATVIYFLNALSAAQSARLSALHGDIVSRRIGSARTKLAELRRSDAEAAASPPDLRETASWAGE